MGKKKRSVGIRELKNRASRIVDEVCEKETPYVVTKRGEPVAVIRPWSAEDARSARAEKIEGAFSSFDKLADRVARAAGRRSAAVAVSEQRR